MNRAIRNATDGCGLTAATASCDRRRHIKAVALDVVDLDLHRRIEGDGLDGQAFARRICLRGLSAQLHQVKQRRARSRSAIGDLRDAFVLLKHFD